MAYGIIGTRYGQNGGPECATCLEIARLKKCLMQAGITCGNQLLIRVRGSGIVSAVSKLPPRKKLALARWLETQVSDCLTDEEMMAIAADGARVLDRREAAYAKRKTR